MVERLLHRVNLRKNVKKGANIAIMPSNNVFDMKIVHENTHLTELCNRDKCQNTVPAKDGYGAEVTVGPGGVGEVRHGEDHPDQDGCHAGGVGDHHGHRQEDVGRQVHAAHL